MCGIAGLYDYGSHSGGVPDEQIGLRMTDALLHRGPDSGGLLVADRLLLGHRRLAILDLSPRGDQPMQDGRRQCWIVLNGEIYNYRELRRELEADGHAFQSETDTEVILHGYRQWGRAVAERLNGMFAFALWDAQAQELWLVRDPVGIKPLFYYDDGRTLRFGSEIKAILADPAVPRRLDHEAIDTFLTLGYVAAPQTAFTGIRQLLPGESLLVSRQGVLRRRWGKLPYPAERPSGRLDEAVERLDDALQQAVERQMVSDVPVGAMLSGGLDSSAVVRAMTRGGRAGIETFSASFAESAFDEGPFAEQVARRFGTRHYSERVAAQAAELLPAIVSHAEEPLADNSMLPLFLLSRFVRGRVTVALSGDGADELLGGYDTYTASRWAPWYRMLPGPLRRHVIVPLVHRLRPSAGKYGTANVLRRFVDGAEQPRLRDHCSWRRIVSQRLRERLYTDKMLSYSADAIALYAASADDAPEWLSDFERQLHVDLTFHLPNDMLVKVDRMSMAHGLEVRVPLLDLEVIRTCLSLPPDVKRQGRRGKRVLRELLLRDMPRDLVERRKAGFLIPLEAWTQSAWQPFLREHLNAEWAAETGLVRWPVLKEMLDAQAARREDYAYPLFALLVLALWWRIWITGEMAPQTLRPEAPATRVIRLAELERKP